MKALFSLYFAVAGFAGTAQNASFTVQHAPLSPNDTAWVAAGDTITFIYGGGGPHPMTSGHGTFTPSPVFFPTVTVTAANPTATCVLDSVGTYLFHCGTNPGNSNNWGTIVVGQIGLTEHSTSLKTWVSNKMLHLGELENGTLIRLIDDGGRCILRHRSNGQPIDLSAFNPGIYTVIAGRNWTASRFVLP